MFMIDICSCKNCDFSTEKNTSIGDSEPLGKLGICLTKGSWRYGIKTKDGQGEAYLAPIVFCFSRLFFLR
ncbi:hypothetical protein CARUB_v10025719mg [Capsella rubella]|uniref:Uncharacterized protein n=1 Tax=Capsella rubella TaxID=81985 RepID=R0G2A0_9BRAS|nr:hypothetical protein CARUB_v10025719mg [Capsella rubella]